MPAKKKSTKVKKKIAVAVKTTEARPNNTILAWTDDPGSVSGAAPIARPVPKLESKPLATRILGSAPAPRAYTTGTREFRYWAAADALRRTADFWGGLLAGGTKWQSGQTLPVTLDQGIDFNAFYDRRGLHFFHGTAGGKTVYSGESPDVVCHEEGHAVLDTIRPQLWDAASDEAASFHESFADITALLSALQLQPMRRAVLAETGGRLYRSSLLSRFAEQLGWALRQIRPDLVEPDCLRNAVNSFFYQAPDKLPPDGPASILSSEPHSFSRVFTGGFFAAMAGMLDSRTQSPTEEDLLQLSQDAGRLLISAIVAAPITPDYYSQVAAHLVESDTLLFRGKYRDAIKSAFVRRGILSVQAASAITSKPAVRPKTLSIAAASNSAKLPKIPISVDEYGIRGQKILVCAPAEKRRLLTAPAHLDIGTATPPTEEMAAKSFVEDLFRRGRVDVGIHGDKQVRMTHPRARKTHELVQRPNGLELSRRIFDCGF